MVEQTCSARSLKVLRSRLPRQLAPSQSLSTPRRFISQEVAVSIRLGANFFVTCWERGCWSSRTPTHPHGELRCSADAQQESLRRWVQCSRSYTRWNLIHALTSYSAW